MRKRQAIVYGAFSIALLILIISVSLFWTSDKRTSRSPQNNQLSSAQVDNLEYEPTTGGRQIVVVGRGVTTPQNNALSSVQIDNYEHNLALGARQVYVNSSSIDVLYTAEDPSLCLTNTKAEDIDGGRVGTLCFKGTQSGSEVSTLGTIRAEHDGAADDEMGRFVFAVNDGTDGDTPTDVLTITDDLIQAETAIAGTMPVPLVSFPRASNSFGFGFNYTGGDLAALSGMVSDVEIFTSTQIAGAQIKANRTGGTSANIFGAWIKSVVTGGTTTNNYTLYLESPSGATNNYGLIVEDGRSGFRTTTPKATVAISGSQGAKVSNVTTATYTITETDYIITVAYTATGAVTLTLPAASDAWESAGATGMQFLIADIGLRSGAAGAGTNNITINAAGADDIVANAGAVSSVAISTDGGKIWIGAIAADGWMVY